MYARGVCQCKHRLNWKSYKAFLQHAIVPNVSIIGHKIMNLANVNPFFLRGGDLYIITRWIFSLWYLSFTWICSKVVFWSHDIFMTSRLDLFNNPTPEHRILTIRPCIQARIDASKVTFRKFVPIIPPPHGWYPLHRVHHHYTRDGGAPMWNSQSTGTHFCSRLVCTGL